jgi:carbamoyltransferase
LGDATVLGLSAFYHDSAACLVEGSSVVAAAEEERFSRRKHDGAFPIQAVRACLDMHGKTIADVHAIAYYEDPWAKADRQLWMSQFTRSATEIEPTAPETAIREQLGFEGPIHYVPHHLSHAASAFLFSGYDDAVVLVNDGVGEWATSSAWHAHRDGLTPLWEVRFPDSLGLFYSAITAFCGFAGFGDEYKLMGLAPYGDSRRFRNQIADLISWSRSGHFKLDMNYFAYLSGSAMFSPALSEGLGVDPRDAEGEICAVYADIAAAAQAILEEVVLAQTAALRDTRLSLNLCVAGGVGLNCVANRRVRAESDFHRFFFQPVAGDAGGSMGAAALVARECYGTSQYRVSNLFLGRSYRAEVDECARRSGINFLDLRASREQAVRRVVDQLSTGAVVGWYEKRSEFGPRALGARSILADPRRRDMRDHLNRVVKLRELFRPFAPITLEHEAARLFGTGDEARPFMIETVSVLPEAGSLPAVTHVDGSARLQTVGPDDGLIYHLLVAWYQRTGCPVLVNTSFNLRGEPIVERPEDALRTFVHSGIDVLYLDGYLATRRDIDTAWAKVVPKPSEERSEHRQRTYAFF